MANTRKTTSGKDKSYDGFSEDERAAMKDRAKELKAAKAKVDPEVAVLEKIAELPEAERAIAERIHTLVKETAPELAPKTYYGMPAYARDGKIVCFFQPASKFDSRYSTFGFEAQANLDDGSMWPTHFALTKLTAADEKLLRAMVKQAIS